MLPYDAHQCLHNVRHRQYRPQSQFNDCETVLPRYSSLLQHPCFTGEGVDRSTVIVGGSREASSKMVGRLLHYYTDVPPVTTNMKNISVPATSMVSLTRNNFKEQTEDEYMCIEHARLVIEDNTGTDENISWSACHASRQPQLARTITLPTCFCCSLTVPTQ